VELRVVVQPFELLVLYDTSPWLVIWWTVHRIFGSDPPKQVQSGMYPRRLASALYAISPVRSVSLGFVAHFCRWDLLIGVMAFVSAVVVPFLTVAVDIPIFRVRN
jgi:hypothetical protein